MKRWCRPLILIALLLLAGAVVNGAVACVLAGAPDSWTPGGLRITIEQDERVPAWILPRGDCDPMGACSRRGLGWRVVVCAALDRHELEPLTIEAVAAGWPALSFVSRETRSRSSRNRSWAVIPPRQLLPSREWFPYDRRRLPVVPIPAGFAINTLFYTAILALPLSFFPIRRRLRTRRGRCPKCGYDRAGLAQRAARCPECGAVR